MKTADVYCSRNWTEAEENGLVVDGDWRLQFRRPKHDDAYLCRSCYEQKSNWVTNDGLLSLKHTRHTKAHQMDEAVCIIIGSDALISPLCEIRLMTVSLSLSLRIERVMTIP